MMLQFGELILAVLQVGRGVRIRIVFVKVRCFLVVLIGVQVEAIGLLLLLLELARGCSIVYER